MTKLSKHDQLASVPIIVDFAIAIGILHLISIKLEEEFNEVKA